MRQPCPRPPHTPLECSMDTSMAPKRPSAAAMLVGPSADETPTTTSDTRLRRASTSSGVRPWSRPAMQRDRPTHRASQRQEADSEHCGSTATRSLARPMGAAPRPPCRSQWVRGALSARRFRHTPHRPAARCPPGGVDRLVGYRWRARHGAARFAPIHRTRSCAANGRTPRSRWRGRRYAAGGPSNGGHRGLGVGR